MKGYLRILLLLVVGASLAMVGCPGEAEPDPGAVDTAADPSAIMDMPADPEAGPAEEAAPAEGAAPAEAAP